PFMGIRSPLLDDHPVQPSQGLHVLLVGQHQLNRRIVFEFRLDGKAYAHSAEPSPCRRCSASSTGRSAGGKANCPNSSGAIHLTSAQSTGFACPSAIAQRKKCISTVRSGYSFRITCKWTGSVTVIDSSARNSRRRQSSNVSPASRFPPGNSHN